MTTQSYSSLIEKTMRLLTPTQVEQALQVSADYVANAATLTVDSTSPAYAAAGRPGTILACGLQLFYVQSDAGSGVLNVIPGYQGSTSVNIAHSATAATATVYVKPKFTRFDVGVAINDELLALNAPDVGLGQILTTDVTFVPVYMGYPLPATFDAAGSYILEIQAKLPLPSRRYPLIRRGEYRTLRNQTSAGSGGDFPNGCGFVVYSNKPYAGQPLHVQFLAPFSPLVNLTDDVLTVAGVPASAQDIVSMGAALRLAPDREIQRNTMSAQPDPRKAAEVPPNAIANSGNALLRRYMMRINQEVSRLKRNFPNAER